jgi:two-component sensor histidine kinase
METRRNTQPESWLGHSNVARLIRTHDWARTPLGPIESWPPCLRTALGICLHSTAPVAVYWGGELITLYNDVCAHFLGDRHPGALGMPAEVLYSDIWESMGPLFLAALNEGICTGSRNQPRPIKPSDQREEHWFDFTATPVRDERGRVGGILVVAFEITDHLRTAQALAEEMAELRRLQSQQRVLVAELQHRTRNLLAVVRAIASQTFGNTLSETVLSAFLERLSSLGRVQGLISRADGVPVKLADIVWAELEAYVAASRHRLEVHGPDVRLSHHQVQTVALALHELVTNAVKYGALRSPSGRLSITWESWLGVRGQQRVALLWRESGVSMPARPVIHRGQGRELLENSLRFSLHADTQLVFGSDGVWCRIELPVEGTGQMAIEPAALQARS